MFAFLLSVVAATAVIFATPASASDQPSPEFLEQPVSLIDGAVALHGTLLTPGPDAAEFDAILILSGSGPTDRDGNQPAMKNDSLKLLAHALGHANIASLRVDKRGIAASAYPGMREEDLRFERYADDAALWLRFLRAQPGVRRVFVVGHSEGALVGLLAAQRERIDGYVSLAGAGDRASNILRRQLRAQGEAVLALAEPTLAKLDAGQLDPAPNLLLAQLFRPSVRPYLISWFKYDPAEEITEFEGPVLIVQGLNDIQITREDAERLKHASPKAIVVLLDKMNHVLKDAPGDRAGNLATYSDPALPLSPAVPAALISLIGPQ